MKLSEMQEYVFKTKIYLDDEKKDFVILRELNTQEMNGLDLKDTDEANKKNLQYLQGLFKDCLVEHTFIKDDSDDLLNKKEVYEALKKSGTLFTEILMTWMNSLPFSQRLNKEKSDK